MFTCGRMRERSDKKNVGYKMKIELDIRNPESFKTNMDLFSCAKLFKFKYGRKVIKIESRMYKNEEKWLIICEGLVFEREINDFVSTWNGDKYAFDTVYDAFKVVQELIK